MSKTMKAWNPQLFSGPPKKIMVFIDTGGKRVERVYEVPEDMPNHLVNLYAERTIGTPEEIVSFFKPGWFYGWEWLEE